MASSPVQLIAILTAVLLTVGCVSLPAGSDTTSSTTKGPTSNTGSGDSLFEAMDEPDPSQGIMLDNNWNRSVELHLRVIREKTSEAVFNQTYTLSPGESRSVYNTARANPEGIESFTVIMTARNSSERVRIETSACYGGVTGRVTTDGNIRFVYAVC